MTICFLAKPNQCITFYLVQTNLLQNTPQNQVITGYNSSLTNEKHPNITTLVVFNTLITKKCYLHIIRDEKGNAM